MEEFNRRDTVRVVALFHGSYNDFTDSHEIPVFVCPPLVFSRRFFRNRCCKVVPMWVITWLAPMLLAAVGFLLQNFQLRIGTYYYVHEMVEHDLQTHIDVKHSNHTDDFQLAVGSMRNNVSFELADPVADLLGKGIHVDIGFLDKLAAGFPLLFVVLVIAVDAPFVWTRIMFCFFILALGKGLFSWITIVPDSNSWQGCQDRLSRSRYSVQWYSEDRSILELLFMDPRSRLCADMMYSGHTYFVTLFAFGLHECVRTAMRSTLASKRVLVESLVTLAAVLQQGFEIYYVLISRFHYTSDVVMALCATYLLYTNSTIAVLAMWWTTPNPAEVKDLLQDFGSENSECGFNPDSKWLHNGLSSKGVISLGCCCCSGSQQYIYSREDISSIMVDIEEATLTLKEEHPLKMVPQTRMLLRSQMGLLEKRSLMRVGSLICEDQDEEYETVDGDSS